MSAPNPAEGNLRVVSNKVLIIPQEDDFAARILDARNHSSQLTAAVALATPQAQILAVRRRALQSFGWSIHKSTHAAHVSAAAHTPHLTAQAMGVGGATGTASHEEFVPPSAESLEELESDLDFEVLPGVGALIADADSVDHEKIEKAHALLLPNYFVPGLPTVPVARGLSVGAPAANAWHLANIGADVKHQQGLKGAGITIGVLDTGIDPTHPEFAGKSILFQEFHPDDGRLVASQTRDTASNGHGTHVAGLLAGRQAGAAPDAPLAVAAVLTMPDPATGNNGGSVIQITKGLEWLFTMEDQNRPPVYVINASVGLSGYFDYFYRTIRNGRNQRGVLVMAAVGNSGIFGKNQFSSPGFYDNVIGVGAIDQGNNVCAFSDWGAYGTTPKPDLCAPGGVVWSSLPGGNYGYLSGTSMACPLVTGASVLVLQKHPELIGNAGALETKVLTLVRGLTGQDNIERSGRGTLDLTSL